MSGVVRGEEGGVRWKREGSRRIEGLPVGLCEIVYN